MPALPVSSPHPASGKAAPRMSFLTGQPGRGGRGWACLLLRASLPASPTPAWASSRILDKSQRKPYVSPQERWGFFPLGFRSSSFLEGIKALGKLSEGHGGGSPGPPTVGGSSPGEESEHPSWEQPPPPPDTQGSCSHFPCLPRPQLRDRMAGRGHSSCPCPPLIGPDLPAPLILSVLSPEWGDLRAWGSPTLETL